MKKIIALFAALLLVIGGASCKNQKREVNMNTNSKKVLFINGSPNRDGNTAALAKALLDGYDYETLQLTD